MSHRILKVSFITWFLLAFFYIQRFRCTGFLQKMSFAIHVSYPRKWPPEKAGEIISKKIHNELLLCNFVKFNTENWSLKISRWLLLKIIVSFFCIWKILKKIQFCVCYCSSNWSPSINDFGIQGVPSFTLVPIDRAKFHMSPMVTTMTHTHSHSLILSLSLSLRQYSSLGQTLTHRHTHTHTHTQTATQTYTMSCRRHAVQYNRANISSLREWDQ